MSFIGPRPLIDEGVDHITIELRKSNGAIILRPGITGWAQINGYRGDTSIRKRIDYDIYYIENWSMFFDFKIMLGTIRYGFVNKNAY